MQTDSSQVSALPRLPEPLQTEPSPFAWTSPDDRHQKRLTVLYTWLPEPGICELVADYAGPLSGLHPRSCLLIIVTGKTLCVAYFDGCGDLQKYSIAPRKVDVPEQQRKPGTRPARNRKGWRDNKSKQDFTRMEKREELAVECRKQLLELLAQWHSEGVRFDDVEMIERLYFHAPGRNFQILFPTSSTGLVTELAASHKGAALGKHKGSKVKRKGSGPYYHRSRDVQSSPSSGAGPPGDATRAYDLSQNDPRVQPLGLSVRAKLNVRELKSLYRQIHWVRQSSPRVT